MAVWTTPTNVSSGEADSGKFNTETVANLQYLYDIIGQRFGGDAGSGTTATVGGLTSCITVTHGLGFTPAWVVAIGKSPISGAGIPTSLLADSFTSTTFRVRAFAGSSALGDGVAITFSWIAGADKP